MDIKPNTPSAKALALWKLSNILGHALYKDMCFDPAIKAAQERLDAMAIETAAEDGLEFEDFREISEEPLTDRDIAEII